MGEDRFHQLYEVFSRAFSDYVIPFALTEEQFRNHLNVTGVDLARTIGCYEGGSLVGFSLNGFGEWNRLRTAYDAGTGVIPESRRRGISEAMFRAMLGPFAADGIEQFLLEVITENTAAVELYRKLGFRETRTLLLLQNDRHSPREDAAKPAGVEIRELDELNWDVLRKFWDGEPSWQNSMAALDRTRPLKRFVGAFEGRECIGYIVFSPKFGRLAQMAVRPDKRRQGIGSMLLDEMQTSTAGGFSMQVINADASIESAVRFFEARGFYERLRQFEMLKDLRPSGQDREE